MQPTWYVKLSPKSCNGYLQMMCQYFLARVFMGLSEESGTSEEMGTSCDWTSISVIQIIIGAVVQIICYMLCSYHLKSLESSRTQHNSPIIFNKINRKKANHSFESLINPRTPLYYLTIDINNLIAMQKVCQLYNQGLSIAHRIGGRNIIFFGLLSTAVAVDLLVNDGERPYYGFHLFKRVKPTQTIYEHPY